MAKADPLTLNIRLHLLPPSEYIHYHRHHHRTLNREYGYNARPLDPGWLLNSAPTTERITQWCVNMSEARQLEHVQVEMVAERFSETVDSEAVLLRKWKFAIERPDNAPIEQRGKAVGGVCEEGIHDEWLAFADHFNTLAWEERLEMKMHNVPRQFQGMV